MQPETYALKLEIVANLQVLTLQMNKESIVVTYEIRVFFEGAQKEVFSSIFKKTL
jgi:hypothetical protein